MKRWLLSGLIFSIHTTTSAEPRAVLETDKQPERGETLVWSPLFQASWDKMNTMHAGKPVKVVPPNALIERLDHFKWVEKKVMPPDGYAVYAGLDTKEFARQTADDVKKRFGFDMRADLLPQTGRAHAYYGVLIRDLVFKKQFYRAKKAALAFKDGKNAVHQVSYFGTAKHHSAGYGKHVRILSNPADKAGFVLEIDTDRAAEKIIIYRPKKAVTFDRGIQHVVACRKSPCRGRFGETTFPYLWEGDIIKIPYLKIQAHTDFTHLFKATRYYNDDPRPWNISRAYQVTEFELGEKGARIRLQTGTADAFGDSPVPRKFICDRPFFVFAWKDGAELPYFAAWIDGADALAPFKP